MLWLTTLVFSALAVAPHDLAITVAMTRNARCIIVTEIRDDGIEGVDVTDAIPSPDVFAAATWARLHGEELTRRPRLTMPYAALQPGAGDGEHHIAAAVNYVDHARETSLTPGDVFVFPKLGTSTGQSATVGTAKGELLDHEIELCARFDRTLRAPSELADARVALFLCHDWSERAVVIREFDEKRPREAGGFTRGKSHPGYFQSSPIVVVPHDWRQFERTIAMELQVDGQVRQNGHTRDMVLSIEELAAEAMRCGAARTYRTWTGAIAVLPRGVIEPDMTLLTGTPAGVALSPPSTWFRIANGIEYFVTGLFGPFYRTTPRSYVREEFIDAMTADRVFLQPGQVVRSSATYLGTLEARIVEDSGL